MGDAAARRVRRFTGGGAATSRLHRRRMGGEGRHLLQITQRSMTEGGTVWVCADVALLRSGNGDFGNNSVGQCTCEFVKAVVGYFNCCLCNQLAFIAHCSNLAGELAKAFTWVR